MPFSAMNRLKIGLRNYGFALNLFGAPRWYILDHSNKLRTVSAERVMEVERSPYLVPTSLRLSTSNLAPCIYTTTK